MKKFKPKFKPWDVVKCYGSGQFMCYGVVKGSEDALSDRFPYPYYSIALIKPYPRPITDEDVYGFGGICVRENEMELYQRR